MAMASRDAVKVDVGVGTESGEDEINLRRLEAWMRHYSERMEKYMDAIAFDIKRLDKAVTDIKQALNELKAERAGCGKD